MDVDTRLHHGDAREVIDKLPPASLDAAYLLYPDPWPKTRHHKRRFISPQTLGELARVLKPGGRVAFATWPPEHLVGRMFAFVGRNAPPPPPGAAPPAQWGNPAIVAERARLAARLHV